MRYMTAALGRISGAYRNHGVALPLYYLQRLAYQKQLRKAIVFLLSTVVGKRVPAEAGFPDEDAKLFALQRDGLISMGQLLSPAQCDDILRYLRYLRDKHFLEIDGGTEKYTLDSRPKSMRFGAYGLKDIVHCPHILELANRPEFIRLAARYLGCTPTISIMSVRWSFPGGAEHAVQRFHRDSEDWKYVRIMVYLTDVVDNDSGPHVYVTGTHQEQASLRLKFLSDDEVERAYGQASILKQTGLRGEGFVVDTSGIHKGQVPVSGDRLLLSVQYSILPCYLYQYHPVEPPPGTRLNKYLNRLIVKQ